MRQLLGTLAIALLPSVAGAAPACDLLKIEFEQGSRLFSGTAFPMKTAGGTIVVTPDHVYPSDLEPTQIRLSLNETVIGSAWIHKRDWSSDLMILQPPSTGSLKPCLTERAELPALSARTSFNMVGYPVASGIPLNRPATLADPRSFEIRVAQPVNVIKVTGLPEKGMSGGLLSTAGGQIAGVLIQDWYGANQELKGGAYALPVDFVVRRVNELLRAPNDELEAPLPFRVRRDAAELLAFGFRFRTTENRLTTAPAAPATPTAKSPALNLVLAGGGGGHPDGIGGEANPTAIEVIGLSGEEVPAELRSMERLLRRIQSQGGMEMLIQETVDGTPLRSITELARTLVISVAPPRFEYSLRSIASERPALGTETIDSLLEQIVIDGFKLADLNAELRPLARQAQQAYTRWSAERSASAVQELLVTVKSHESALDRVLDLEPGAWTRVIEFRVRVQKLAKRLG